LILTLSSDIVKFNYLLLYCPVWMLHHNICF